MGLICDYPCKLDLWAKVIKSKSISRQQEVLDEYVCIPDADVGGKITLIDDIKVQGVMFEESFIGYTKVKVTITFNLILIVVVGEGDSATYELVTLQGFSYTKEIPLDEFDPPLTPQEFKTEIDQSETVLKNWYFDYDIIGPCEETESPCFVAAGPNGTCLLLKAFVDIIVKLGKWHDVVVYGEYDPEVDP